MRLIVIVLSLIVAVHANTLCDDQNGGCQQKCLIVNGAVRCACDDGFELNHDNTSCHDTNPCNTRNGGCEQICVGSDHKSTCACRDNFEPMPSRPKKCQLKDLCSAARNKGGCEQNCKSINGTKVECSCRIGFALEKDGKNCYDADLCDDKNGGCVQKCENKGKGKKECSCFAEYMKDPKDSNNCIRAVDYVRGVEAYLLRKNDECKVDNGGCSHYCRNTIDSYKCECDADHELGSDGKTCEKWSWYWTLIIILIIFAILILIITIWCLCGKFKWLAENICCKCFCSWKCCMTGLFCKCNKRSEADVTDLYYHQVNLQISPYKEKHEVVVEGEAKPLTSDHRNQAV